MRLPSCGLAGRERLFRLVLLGLFIPPQVAMLPLFILMRELHLVDSFAAVVIPSMASVFGIFLDPPVRARHPR